MRFIVHALVDYDYRPAWRLWALPEHDANEPGIWKPFITLAGTGEAGDGAGVDRDNHSMYPSRGVGTLELVVF